MNVNVFAALLNLGLFQNINSNFRLFLPIIFHEPSSLTSIAHGLAYSIFFLVKFHLIEGHFNILSNYSFNLKVFLYNMQFS